MQVRIYIFVSCPPLQGILHVLDRVAEVLLYFACTRRGGDRKVAEGCESVVVHIRIVLGCRIQFISRLLVLCGVLLSDQSFRLLDPFSLPLLIMEVLEFHARV
jgi:hypothetical protein